MLGVPDELFREVVLGIEMEIGEEAVARPVLDIANDTDAFLVIAGSERVSFRMVDVDFGAFVEADGAREGIGQVLATVARDEAQHFDAADDSAAAIDAQDLAARVAEFLDEIVHTNLLFMDGGWLSVVRSCRPWPVVGCQRLRKRLWECL